MYGYFQRELSAEYIDAEGNYQCFDTEAEALAYIKEDEDEHSNENVQ
jgi:hypothetical protein